MWLLKHKVDKPKEQPPKPALLKPRVVLFFIAVLLITKFIGIVLETASPTEASDLTISSIFNAINKERSLRNLVTLNTNDKLGYAAQSKSDDIIERKYFAHVDPDGHYIWDKIVAAGYSPYTELGENLAIEFSNTESLVAAWMNSPTHRANILQEGFRDQGMGLSLGDTALGQYSSAIANTFGTLAQKKVSAIPTAKAIPAPLPTPAPLPSPQPKIKPSPALLPTPDPIPPAYPKTSSDIQTPSSASSSSTNPDDQKKPTILIAVRGTTEESPSFATPKAHDNATTTASSVPETIHPNNLAIRVTDSRQFSRYLTIGFGIILLIFLMTDLGKAIEQKWNGLDKKLNNMVVLILSLFVMAFIYWF